MSATLTICRICLRTDSLTPIFMNAKQHERYTVAIFLTTGLQVEINDGLPQTMCSDCRDMINKAIDFRNQGLKSEQTLLRWGFHRYSVGTRHEVKMKDYFQAVELMNKGEYFKKGPTSVKREVEEPPSVNEKIEINIKEEQIIPVKQEPKNELKIEIESEDDCAVTFNDESFQDTTFEDFNNDNSVTYETSNKEPVKYLGWSDDSFEFIMPEKKKRRHIKSSKPNSKSLEHSIYAHLTEKPLGLPGPYKCKVCERILKSYASFRGHARSHTEKSNALPIVCEFCGKSFAAVQFYKRHTAAMHGTAMEHQCQLCDYSAWCSDRLKTHIRRAHTGETPFVCDTCGKGFYTRTNITHHLAVHMTERNVQCSRCPARFKTRQQLFCHSTRVHAPAMPRVECHICHKTYTKLSGMKEHCWKIHGVRLPVDHKLKGRKKNVCEVIKGDMDEPTPYGYHKEVDYDILPV